MKALCEAPLGGVSQSGRVESPTIEISIVSASNRLGSPEFAGVCFPLGAMTTCSPFSELQKMRPCLTGHQQPAIPGDGEAYQLHF